jgi:hypothetical protein
MGCLRFGDRLELASLVHVAECDRVVVQPVSQVTGVGRLGVDLAVGVHDDPRVGGVDVEQRDRGCGVLQERVGG